jgi:hypothetical protein
MTKKALCVGINTYPIQGMDLSGCVNDAHAWASLLNEHYDFPTADISMLIESEATYAAIIAGLKSLLAGAQPGDVLVFTNSSHGTYLVDADGDESMYDEALCPYDVVDHPLVDDELRVLFSDLPAGVRLTVISDSCHSGTVTRAVPFTPDRRKPRFLRPKALGLPELDNPRACRPDDGTYPASGMKEVLLAACRDIQYAFDATLDGTPHGVFTYHALATIAASDYAITYRELRERVLSTLQASAYDQEPQCEGSDENIDRQIFT